MVASKYSGEVLLPALLGKRFRGGGMNPLISFLWTAWGWRVVGISMNLGLSGPIAERGAEVLNSRGLAALRHLNRGRGLNCPVGSEGGISKVTCAGSGCADEVVFVQLDLR